MATLERWPLTRRRSEYINSTGSSTKKLVATLERVASVESGH